MIKGAEMPLIPKGVSKMFYKISKISVMVYYKKYMLTEIEIPFWKNPINEFYKQYEKINTVWDLEGLKLTTKELKQFRLIAE